MNKVVEEMDAMQDKVKGKEKEIRKLCEQLEEQTKVVSSVAVTKDKFEVKASSKDMEERLKGTVSREFLLLVFLMNQFPPSP
jgi:hypothetical protein